MAAAAGAAPVGSNGYKAKRINRAIELLAADQPIYYTGGSGGYAEGVKAAGNLRRLHQLRDGARLAGFQRAARLHARSG